MGRDNRLFRIPSVLSLVVLGLLFALISCNPIYEAEDVNKTLTPTKIIASTLPARTPSPSPTKTISPTPISISVESADGSLSPTPAILKLNHLPALVGTPIAQRLEPIDHSNIEKLIRAAQWGRGRILDVAFVPDGDRFVVSSAYGLSIYDQYDPESSVIWVPLDEPYYHRGLFFEQSGEYLLLEGFGDSRIYSFPELELVEQTSDVKWVKSTEFGEWGALELVSPSGKLQFRSHTTHDELWWDVEYSIREIFDSDTNELITEFNDETMQIYFGDRNDPEGCDLNSFSYCGNSYAPAASLPFRVGFTQNDENLGILYRPPNLWNTNRYSTLRIYEIDTGNVVDSFGGINSPLETFAFSPDGSHLLLGYIDGSVMVWDMEEQELNYASRDFSSEYHVLRSSNDGDFLFARSPGSLEVRRTSDGALRSRYQGSSFAIHPTDPIIAIGESDGGIKLLNIATGDTVWIEQGHEAEVFSLSFSSDGQYLVSSGGDCKIYLWDARNGEFLHPFEKTVVNAYGEDFTESRIFLYYFDFVPGAEQLLGFGSWGTVVNWDVNSGATNYSIASEPLDYYQGMMTLDPHFPAYFESDFENDLIFINNYSYDLENGVKVGDYLPPERLPLDCGIPNWDTVTDSLVFARGYDSFDGKICALSTNDLSIVSLLEIMPGGAESQSGIDWFYLSPDGTKLYVTTLDGPVFVYHIGE